MYGVASKSNCTRKRKEQNASADPLSDDCTTSTVVMKLPATPVVVSIAHDSLEIRNMSTNMCSSVSTNVSTKARDWNEMMSGGHELASAQNSMNATRPI